MDTSKASTSIGNQADEGTSFSVCADNKKNGGNMSDGGLSEIKLMLLYQLVTQEDKPN